METYVLTMKPESAFKDKRNELGYTVKIVLEITVYAIYSRFK